MPAKFSVFTVAAMPLIPIALACGGDDDGKVMVMADAAMVAVDVAAACTTPPSYSPSFGSGQFAETATGSDGDTRTAWQGILNNDPAPDALLIELYSGFGTFSSGAIEPKTIPLTGDETNYRDCGACLLLATDLMQAGSGISASDEYFANGGTLTLTSVEDTFQGTLSDVTFRQVNIAQDLTTTDHPSGCTTTIPNATLNAPIDDGDGSAAGTSARRLNGSIPVRVVLKNRKVRF